MIDEKLVIEKIELFKERIMERPYLRYTPQHFCMVFDRFVEYINSIKVDEES